MTNYINGAIASELSGNPDSNLDILLPFAQTVGQTLIIAINWFGNLTDLASVTDTVGNTYSEIPGTACQNTDEPNVSIAYVCVGIVASAAGTNTITCAFSPDVAYPNIQVSLVANVYGIDTANSLGEPPSSPMNISVTTTEDNDYLWGAAEGNGGDLQWISFGNFTAQFTPDDQTWYVGDDTAGAAGVVTWSPTAEQPEYGSLILVAFTTTPPVRNANNDILFNAAINGFVKAQLQGRGPASSNADDYSLVVTHAATFAKTIDSMITTNEDISNSDGTALTPTTSAIQEAQLGQIQAMESATYAVFAGAQSATSSSPNSYIAQATVVNAIFTETISALTTS